MVRHLLIVESPSKAKTIAKFLSSDFCVKSSIGHIRDLEKKGMGIDIDNNYCARYTVPAEKVAIVKELQSQVKKVDQVWLATDEDREGEAIGWHLCEALGLDPQQTKRIVFHEITRKAILHSIEHPRTLDMNLVNAQQARRVLDRIVGFTLSPLLQKKISGWPSLSAGRVQSVALRLIVEREEDIQRYTRESFFKIKAFFHSPDPQDPIHFFTGEGEDVKDITQAEDLLLSCREAVYTVEDTQTKPRKKSPPPPFTTSTLQQMAAQQLGYPVAKTMQIAQKLYENGDITYMRTDSLNLSDSALAECAEKIKQTYGAQYLHTRRYKTKNTSAQEAHEAIRPTNMHVERPHSEQGRALYRLIWQRTIASQMVDAQMQSTHVQIGISTLGQTKLYAHGDSVVFDGYMSVYNNKQSDKKAGEILLPKLRKGDNLRLEKLQALERFTQPKARYSEGSLVKALEELGIGRPSTYAQTISTVIKRGYVHKVDTAGTPTDHQLLILDAAGHLTKTIHQENTGAEKGRLQAKDIGKLVNDYLVSHFEKIVDYTFTAHLEEQFDRIAHGEIDWVEVVDRFYRPFQAIVHTNLNNNADVIASCRELGVDAAGRKVVTRVGVYGSFVQIGDKNDNPLYASIPKNMSVHTITLEQALGLFVLPRQIGEYQGEEMTIDTGRYGPYVQYKGKNYSLGEVDPYTISHDQVVDILAKKLLLPRDLGMFENKTVKVAIGPYGPYVRWGEEFISLPKNTDAYTISQEQVHNRIRENCESIAKRTIQAFPTLNAIVLSSRFGPVIKVGNKRVHLPANLKKNAASLTEEQVRHVLDADAKSKPNTKKKKKK